MSVLDQREKVVVRLARIEGMRPGEILALRIGDVELSESRINVRGRLYRGNIDTPKNVRGTREVALSVGTVSLLEAWLDRLIRNSAESWVFECEHPASPLGRDNVWKHILKQLNPIGMEWATFQVDTVGRRPEVREHFRPVKLWGVFEV